jgi:hypothetical protein
LAIDQTSIQFANRQVIYGAHPKGGETAAKSGRQVRDRLVQRDSWERGRPGERYAEGLAHDTTKAYKTMYVALRA